MYRIFNKYSKELFDYGVGIHKTKERLSEKKKKDVMYLLSYIRECQRSL